MKIYVVCDIEGAAGVVNHRQQCCWDLSKGWFGPYYEQARRLVTLELNALVEGVLAGGATEIVAWDGHGNFPGGLDVELLHPACRMVMGAGDAGPAGLDDSFDALFQCGLHAMAGAPGGVMAHTFMGHIAGYWVNEQPVGEIWMNAYTAGLSGVPFVFISGDRAATVEAQALVPEVETVVVKEGLFEGPGSLDVVPTLSMAPERSREVIREGAARALRKIGHVPPLTAASPYDLRLQFKAEGGAETVAARPGVELVNATTVAMRGVGEPWLLL